MTGRDDERDEIELLLPWHAVGRLPPEDAARVEAALARDPERARRLEIAREERDETVALNQALGVPSRAARDALFARIEAEGRAPRRGFAEGLRDALARLSPAAIGWAGAAAVLVIALQAGFLARAYLTEGGPGYETASAPSAGAPAGGRFALAAFAPGATAAQIETLLRETRVTIVDGPRPGGLYRLRLGDRTMAARDAVALIERLKAETGIVRLVAPEAPDSGN